MTSQLHSSLTDLELEQLAVNGDRDAFGVLYERHEPAVRQFVANLLGDADEAADVTQEAFIRALGATHNRKPGEAGFSTYIFQIAKRLAWRRSGRRSHTCDITTAENTVSSEDDPYTPARVAELQAIVREAARALKPREFALFDLYVRQEKTVHELAAIAQKSANAMWVQLNRFKKNFEAAVTTTVLLRSEGQRCPQLSAVVKKYRAGDELTASVRKAVMKHIDACDYCDARRRELISGENMLRGLAPFPLAAAIRHKNAEAAWQAICDERSAASTPRSRKLGRRLRKGAAGALAGLLAFLVPLSPAKALAASAVLATAIVAGGFCYFGVGADDSSARTAPPTTTAEEVSGPRDVGELNLYGFLFPYIPREPTETAVALAVGGAPPISAAAAPPTSTPITAPRVNAPPTATNTSLPPLTVTCDSFWQSRPVDGEGFDHDFEALLMQEGNAYRAARGVAPLDITGALRAATDGYARYFAQSRWWESHPGESVHEAGGTTLKGRVLGTGLVGEDGSQSFDPAGWRWGAIGENVFWGDGLNPCEGFAKSTSYHLANLLGHVTHGDGTAVSFPYAAVSTSCYVIYATRTYACVQDFVYH